jgi:hypothetical protein
MAFDAEEEDECNVISGTLFEGVVGKLWGIEVVERWLLASSQAIWRFYWTLDLSSSKMLKCSRMPRRTESISHIQKHSGAHLNSFPKRRQGSTLNLRLL